MRPLNDMRLPGNFDEALQLLNGRLALDGASPYNFVVCGPVPGRVAGRNCEAPGLENLRGETSGWLHPPLRSDKFQIVCGCRSARWLSCRRPPHVGPDGRGTVGSRAMGENP